MSPCVHSIRQKNHPLKDDLLLCLSSLVKLSGDCGTAEEWTNLVDRRGLVPVNEITFSSLWKTRIVIV